MSNPVEPQGSENDISQETQVEETDFLSELGFGAPKKANQTPEEEFYDDLTGQNGTRYAKIANLRYWLNHEMSGFQFLKESGIKITKQDDAPIAITIPGAMVKPAQGSKTVQRQITNLEYLKLKIEYYMLMTHYPHFKVIPDQPQRRVCSMSKIVDLCAEHESIKELVHKKY